MEEPNETAVADFPNGEFVFENITEQYENSDYFLPNWILAVYFAFVLIGSAVDLIYVLALLRCKKDGTFAIILQLVLADALAPFLAVVEILTINNKTWIFSQNTCQLYNGSEVLINSLQLWLVICANFHVISLWNLRQNEQARKRNNNPLTSCRDESNECLVSRREINIDYRRRKEDVSVAIPCVLVWFFCLSLSIPNLTFSSVIKTNNLSCVLVNNSYGYFIRILILVFRVIVPLPLLVFSLVCIVIKLTKSSLNDIKNILTKDISEMRLLLVFCVSLTVLYLCTSFQRSLFHVLHISFEDFYDGKEYLKVTPLYHIPSNISNKMSLTMLHYSCNTLRVVLIFCLLPKFKDLLRKKVFVCL
ncbi:unnamed protein product [Phyllotreta striolata]|uniref:G-protein coupled receptors family 1 profile domain-containing protein n=1 Tax=Phyllotreta striolata TaxID=444603 RepID=A0A9N9TUB2_PHYSR|nr:unnamed protein product [Phyllotreta striolata]